MLLVTATEAERVKRWVEKGNDVADARRRIAAQISPEEAKKRVTDVLVNDGSLETLRRKVQALYLQWTTPPKPTS